MIGEINQFHRIRKPKFLLLEILIALVLVFLCLFPLLKTQVFILERERKFVHEIEAQRLVNLALVEIIEKLYTNQIKWQAIEERQIDPEALTFNSSKAYQIHYQLYAKEKLNNQGKLEKVNETKKESYHMITVILTISSTQSSKDLSYTYDLFIEKHLKDAEPLTKK